MALLLLIDTSTEDAFVGLEEDGALLAVEKNNLQKEHAAFLHPAIEQLLKKCNLSMVQLDAIAVASGPGSYTGLRVAMATAKGLCFALGIPLITLNNLKLMAKAAILNFNNKEYLFCPMIDARRMEVFTALYTMDLEVVLHPFALILHEKSYADFLDKKNVYFFGNGAVKFQEITLYKNAYFLPNPPIDKAFTLLAEEAFGRENFASLSLTEPDYIKGFYDGK